MKSLITRISENPTIMTWMSNLLTFGSGLFVLPLILGRFSKVEISFWFLIGTIRGFAMLADAGFGTVLVRAISYFNSGAKSIPRNLEEYHLVENTGEANFPMLNEMLGTSSRMYNLISLFVLVLLSSGGVLLIWNIMTLAEHAPYLWACYGITAVSTIILLQSVKWSSVMQGLNFVARFNGFKTLIGTIKLLVFILLLLLNRNIVYLIAYMLIDDFLLFLFSKNFVKKWFRSKAGVTNFSNVFNKDLFHSLWPPTWKTGILHWGSYIINQGTTLVISQIKNVDLMASFLFTQRVLTLIRRISEAPFFSHLPVIYHHIARKEKVILKQKVSVYISFGLTILVVALLGIALTGNFLLDLLNIDTHFVTGWIFILMSLALILEIHSSFHASIYVSTNEIPFVYPAIISGVIILTAGFLTVNLIGLIGVLLIQLGVQAGFNYWYAPYKSLGLLNWSVKNYIFMSVNGLYRFLVEKILRK